MTSSYKYLTDLADAARKSGLQVVELAGWKTRGRPYVKNAGRDFIPKGIVCHHTGSDLEGTAGTKILLAGRPDLPAPLSQLSLSRSGVVYIVAAGRANHAGAVHSVGFMKAGDGNAQSIGIEAQNSGSEGWSAKQLDAYHKLCAALCDHYGWSRANVVGHGECSTAGKWDPGVHGKMISMGTFRAAVAKVVLPGQTVKIDVHLTVASTRLWGRAKPSSTGAKLFSRKHGFKIHATAFQDTSSGRWYRTAYGTWYPASHLTLV